MIESLFIILIAMAFVMFILQNSTDNQIYGIMSIVLWLLVMGQSIYIQVPGVTDTYSEVMLSALPLAFIFSGVVLMIVRYMENRELDKFTP